MNKSYTIFTDESKAFRDQEIQQSDTFYFNYILANFSNIFNLIKILILSTKTLVKNLILFFFDNQYRKKVRENYEKKNAILSITWKSRRKKIERNQIKLTVKFVYVHSSQTPSPHHHRTWRAFRPRPVAASRRGRRRSPYGRSRRRGRWSRPGSRRWRLRVSSRRCRKTRVFWSRFSRDPEASPEDSGRGTARRARCATVIWCRSTSCCQSWGLLDSRWQRHRRSLLLLLLLLRFLLGDPDRSPRSKSPATDRISLYRGSAPSWKSKSTKSKTRLD